MGNNCSFPATRNPEGNIGLQSLDSFLEELDRMLDEGVVKSKEDDLQSILMSHAS